MGDDMLRKRFAAGHRAAATEDVFVRPALILGATGSAVVAGRPRMNCLGQQVYDALHLTAPGGRIPTCGY